MNWSELKINGRIFDRWYPEYGTGKIIKILKTRVKIKFENLEKILSYDGNHIQFLERKKNKKAGR